MSTLAEIWEWIGAFIVLAVLVYFAWFLASGR